MSAIEVALRLAAVAVLASYLYFKHRQRLPSRPPCSDERQWPGPVIDADALKPRIAAVRRDYLAARPATHNRWFRRHSVALARHAMSRLGYFQASESER